MRKSRSSPRLPLVAGRNCRKEAHEFSHLTVTRCSSLVYGRKCIGEADRTRLEGTPGARAAVDRGSLGWR
jgi:hypothetical protein